MQENTTKKGPRAPTQGRVGPLNGVRWAWKAVGASGQGPSRPCEATAAAPNKTRGAAAPTRSRARICVDVAPPSSRADGSLSLSPSPSQNHNHHTAPPPKPWERSGAVTASAEGAPKPWEQTPPGALRERPLRGGALGSVACACVATKPCSLHTPSPFLSRDTTTTMNKKQNHNNILATPRTITKAPPPSPTHRRR